MNTHWNNRAVYYIFLRKHDLFISFQDFIAKKGRWQSKEVVLPPGSNIVKDWQEVARYVFLLPSLPLFCFIFFFLSLFLFCLFSRKRNCYAQSTIRLFHRCYSEDRNADVGVFSTLWIKFALHSIFFFLDLFHFSSNFVSSFRSKRNSSSLLFPSVAFYVALFLFHFVALINLESIVVQL